MRIVGWNMASFVIDFKVDVFKEPGVDETFSTNLHLPGCSYDKLKEDSEHCVGVLLERVRDYLGLSDTDK